MEVYHKDKLNDVDILIGGLKNIHGEKGEVKIPQ